jgi:parvulin-like peptidyl-prolyl isomerase
VVVGINDYAITTTELEEMVRIFRELHNEPLPFSEEAELRQMVLLKGVDDYLLGEIAKEEGISVSGAEIDNALDSLRGELSPEQFEAELQSKQISLQGLKTKLTRELVGEKVIRWKAGQLREKTSVTDAEVEAFFAQLEAFLTGQEPTNQRVYGFVNQQRIAIDEQARVHFGQIVVQGQEQATLVAERLSEGIDFGELAREYSFGPRAAMGGDLGWISLLDLSLPLRETVAALQDGDVTPPVEVEGDVYRIIQVRAKTFLSISNWMEPIRAYLQSQEIVDALETWITNLREEAYILVHDEQLRI